MNYAEINLKEDVSEFTQTFMILRAATYLYEFHNVEELRLNIAKPSDEVVGAWSYSLTRYTRNITISYNHDTSSVPPFKYPDYKMRVNGTKLLDLGIPEIPNLTDYHIHSPMAFCQENMNLDKTRQMADLSRVKHINISEHSGQLYTIPDTYWNARFIWDERLPEHDRSGDYRTLAEECTLPDVSFGLEMDVDKNFHAIDVEGISGVRLGAVHFIDFNADEEGKKADYLRRLDGLIAGDISILAHPFRVFPRSARMEIPKDLFRPVAERLVHAEVAAEINFHCNRPSHEFFELLLKLGGKISFGTDSHNLFEVGYLRPHYDFCRELGIAEKLDQYLCSY